MEDKILGKFPIEELNLILGGVKSNNIYDFRFIPGKPFKRDKSAELIKDATTIKTNLPEVIQKLFRNIVSTLEDLKEKNSVFVINHNDVNDKVKEYFKTAGTDLCGLYETKDIYEFLEIIDDNTVTKKFNEQINEIKSKNGSIITFKLENSSTGFVESFSFVNTPSEFTGNDIAVHLSPLLFDFVRINESPKVYRGYYYPFTGLDKDILLKAIEEDRALLAASLNFSVEIYKKNDELRAKGIYNTFSFNKCYNIITNNNMPNAE